MLLAGHDAKELLLGASEDRVAEFDTLSPTRGDRIKGFTADDTEVLAKIKVVYRLSISQLAFRFSIQTIHERLAAAVSVYINTALSRRDLELNRTKQEAEIQNIAINSLRSVREVSIAYCEPSAHSPVA